MKNERTKVIRQKSWSFLNANYDKDFSSRVTLFRVLKCASRVCSFIQRCSGVDLSGEGVYGILWLGGFLFCFS